MFEDKTVKTIVRASLLSIVGYKSLSGCYLWKCYKSNGPSSKFNRRKLDSQFKKRFRQNDCIIDHFSPCEQTEKSD